MRAPIVRTPLVVAVRTWNGAVAWKPTAAASELLRQSDSHGIAPAFRAVKALFGAARDCAVKLAPQLKGATLEHGKQRRGGWRIVTAKGTP